MINNNVFYTKSKTHCTYLSFSFDSLFFIAWVVHMARKTIIKQTTFAWNYRLDIKTTIEKQSKWLFDNQMKFYSWISIIIET